MLSQLRYHVKINKFCCKKVVRITPKKLIYQTTPRKVKTLPNEQTSSNNHASFDAPCGIVALLKTVTAFVPHLTFSPLLIFDTCFSWDWETCRVKGQSCMPASIQKADQISNQMPRWLMQTSIKMKTVTSFGLNSNKHDFAYFPNSRIPFRG